MANNDDNRPKKELVVLGPSLPDGSTAAIRNDPNHGPQCGLLKRIGEGESLLGKELVELKQVGSSPVFEMTRIYDGRTPDQKDHDSHGPSMVNSQAYRDGWDSIFGNKKTAASAVN
ncbi:MAG: hypothetical protein WC708_01430 [Lentisphaeria bacterium]|jgi:hypothetical protein